MDGGDQAGVAPSQMRNISLIERALIIYLYVHVELRRMISAYHCIFQLATGKNTYRRLLQYDDNNQDQVIHTFMGFDSHL